mgnify:FL=1|jgi:hypothetical protein
MAAADIAAKKILDAMGCSLAQSDRGEIRGFGSFRLNRHPRLMAGQGQQCRVAADDRALTLKNGALEIVVQGDTPAAVPGGQRADVATQDVLPVSAEVEAQEDLPRPGEYGKKAHQRPAYPTDLQVAEVPPVDLHLLAWQSAQTPVGDGRLEDAVDDATVEVAVLVQA